MASTPPPHPPSNGGQYGPPFGSDWKYQRRILKQQARAQRETQRAQRLAYRAQLRGMKRTSILGPILLIAIGVVFLMVQTGHVSPNTLFSWYGHWWPLLIVGAGVVLLLEWTFDQAMHRRNQPPYYRRGVGAGVVLLLLVLAALGVGAQQGLGGARPFFHHLFPNPEQMDEFLGDKHESTQTVDQPLPPGTQLILNNPRGDVTLAGAAQPNDGKLHLTLQKQVFSRTDSDANDKAVRLTPHFTTSGNTLTVDLPSIDGAHADLVVSLPENIPVTVSSNHGDLRISQLTASVNAIANHGDLDLSTITGNVTAHINHGGSSFSAHNVTGQLSVEGHGQDFTLSDINGPVTFNGDLFGTSHLEHILGPVHFHTSRTDLQIAHIPGSVEINAEDDLTADSAAGPVSLTTRSRNLHLNQISGELNVTDSDGNIDLTLAPPLGNVTVTNRHGDINLTVPLQAAYTLDADTRDGDIENNLGAEISVLENDGRNTAHGTVGSGGPGIRLTTTEGSIHLDRAAVAPLPPTPPPAPASPRSPAPPHPHPSHGVNLEAY
ncbi:MAG: DUF4097 family beta strand repeat protein [Acidobacteriota bacterium]|nr:DUF4097 family beta strand repeat protein [Acidobacteriota bacterium]